jgi:hypothetical protein
MAGTSPAMTVEAARRRLNQSFNSYRYKSPFSSPTALGAGLPSCHSEAHVLGSTAFAFEVALASARFLWAVVAATSGDDRRPVRGLPRTSLPCRIYFREDARLGKRRAVPGSLQCACQSTGPQKT